MMSSRRSRPRFWTWKNIVIAVVMVCVVLVSLIYGIYRAGHGPWSSKPETGPVTSNQKTEPPPSVKEEVESPPPPLAVQAHLLELIRLHRVQSGEDIKQIAEQYELPSDNDSLRALKKFNGVETGPIQGKILFIPIARNWLDSTDSEQQPRAVTYEIKTQGKSLDDVLKLAKYQAYKDDLKYIVAANQVQQGAPLAQGTRLILGVENPVWHEAQPQPAPVITKAELNEALQVFGKNLKSDLIEQLSQRDEQWGRLDRWWYLGGAGIIGLLLGVLGPKAAGLVKRLRSRGSADRGKNMDIFPGIKLVDEKYYRDDSSNALIEPEKFDEYERLIEVLKGRERSFGEDLGRAVGYLLGICHNVLNLVRKLNKDPDWNQYANEIRKSTKPISTGDWPPAWRRDIDMPVLVSWTSAIQHWLLTQQTDHLAGRPAVSSGSSQPAWEAPDLWDREAFVRALDRARAPLPDGLAQACEDLRSILEQAPDLERQGKAPAESMSEQFQRLAAIQIHNLPEDLRTRPEAQDLWARFVVLRQEVLDQWGLSRESGYQPGQLLNPEEYKKYLQEFENLKVRGSKGISDQCRGVSDLYAALTKARWGRNQLPADFWTADQLELVERVVKTPLNLNVEGMDDQAIASRPVQELMVRTPVLQREILASLPTGLPSGPPAGPVLPVDPNDEEIYESCLAELEGEGSTKGLAERGRKLLAALREAEGWQALSPERRKEIREIAEWNVSQAVTELGTTKEVVWTFAWRAMALQRQLLLQVIERPLSEDEEDRDSLREALKGLPSLFPDNDNGGQ